MNDFQNLKARLFSKRENVYHYLIISQFRWQFTWCVFWSRYTVTLMRIHICICDRRNEKKFHLIAVRGEYILCSRGVCRAMLFANVFIIKQYIWIFKYYYIIYVIPMSCVTVQCVSNSHGRLSFVYIIIDRCIYKK